MFLLFLSLKNIKDRGKTIPGWDLEKGLIVFVFDEMPPFLTETTAHVANAKGRFCAQRETQMADSGPKQTQRRWKVSRFEEIQT